MKKNYLQFVVFIVHNNGNKYIYIIHTFLSILEEDEDSFWEFLTGKTTNGTNEENATNKHPREEYEDRVSKNKNAENQDHGNIHAYKHTQLYSSEGDLVNMLRELDDLNKLDDLDESDDDSCTQPLFDEEEEELDEREGVPDVFEGEAGNSRQGRQALFTFGAQFM